jgi:hypothetical protein
MNALNLITVIIDDVNVVRPWAKILRPFAARLHNAFGEQSDIVLCLCKTGSVGGGGQIISQYMWHPADSSAYRCLQHAIYRLQRSGADRSFTGIIFAGTSCQ